MANPSRPLTNTSLANLNAAARLAASGVFCLVDADGERVLDGGKALAAFFGRSPGSQSLPDWLGLADKGRYRQLFATSGDSTSLREDTLAILGKRHRYQWLRFRVQAPDEAPEAGAWLLHLADASSLVAAIEQAAKAQARELDASARLQATVLVGGLEPNLASIDVAATTIPSRYVDGDFHDIYSLSPGTVDLVLGDVMGKGMEAATLGTMVKIRLFRTLAGQLYRQARLPPVERICAWLERSLAGYLATQRSIITLAYARFHEQSGILEFTDCGHTPGVLVRDGHCRSFKGADMPFGFADSQDFRGFLLPLRPGDTMLFYSDGLSECESGDGRQFGEEKIMYVARSQADQGPRTVINHLVKLGFEFSANGFSDDVSLLCLKLLARPPLPDGQACPLPGRRRRHCCLEQGDGRNCGSLSLHLHDVGKAGARLRRRLERLFRGLRCLDEAERGLLLIACHEALANIADHGLTGKNRNCHIEWRLTPGIFSLELAYHGCDYDWLSRPAAGTLQYGDRGYGLSIMHSVMDSVLLCEGLRDEKILVLCRRLACWKT